MSKEIILGKKKMKLNVVFIAKVSCETSEHNLKTKKVKYFIIYFISFYWNDK